VTFAAFPVTRSSCHGPRSAEVKLGVQDRWMISGDISRVSSVLAHGAELVPGGDVADARRMRHFRVCGNLVRFCWYVARMRLSPILPVGLAVAAVALSASLGNTVAEPDKRGNHEVVAFPLFALKSSDRILSSNNHYSHESHSSHESHFSHDSHFSSVSSSPAPAPVTAAPAPVAGSPTATPSPSGSGSAVPAPAGSGSGLPGSGPVPSGSFGSLGPQQQTGDDSGSGGAVAGVIVLVVAAGGVTYVVYRRNRRPR
jgi:hypothetical protein